MAADRHGHQLDRWEPFQGQAWKMWEEDDEEIPAAQETQQPPGMSDEEPLVPPSEARSSQDLECTVEDEKVIDKYRTLVASWMLEIPGGGASFVRECDEWIWEATIFESEPLMHKTPGTVQKLVNTFGHLKIEHDQLVPVTKRKSVEMKHKKSCKPTASTKPQSDSEDSVDGDISQLAEEMNVLDKTRPGKRFRTKAKAAAAQKPVIE